MKMKTHMVVGNALALVAFRPTNVTEMVSVMAAATIGSIISDIDVTTSKSHKELEAIILISFVAIVIGSALDAYTNFGMFQWLRNNLDILKLAICTLVFFIVCFFGMHQPHRSFMHSITACVILSGIIFTMNGYLACYFGFGMMSHILLDLLNKKKVQLLYPIKTKVCFNLCESNGTVDKAFCSLGLVGLIAVIAVICCTFI